MNLERPSAPQSTKLNVTPLSRPADGPIKGDQEHGGLTSNVRSPEKTESAGGTSPTAIDMLRAVPRNKNPQELFDAAVKKQPPQRARELIAAFSSYDTLSNDQSKVDLLNSSVEALERLKKDYPAATPNSYMQKAVDKLTEIAGKLGPDDREKVKERIDASKKILLTEEKFAPDSHNIGGRTQRWMA